VLGTAILYQFSVVVTFMLVFRALDLPIPLAGALALSPAVLMIQVLPITLGGFGLREGALVLFMHPFLEGTDVKDARVLAAGALWYGCLVLVSMLGAPSFAAGRRKQKSLESETA
ncbi:MAG TPA: lysylphosphatidylglycerol synthase domain-containing protein, partial [Acidimicrobiia bacterium]|nr:lysylphosphatidylglycerol synthase domain-containing protein [Acidimicrobiia bacterium]